MPEPEPINLARELNKLQFVGNRTPTSSDSELKQAFAELTAFRDGAIFIGHYAGNSNWERHSRGDEIVFVLDGQTTLVLLSKTGGKGENGETAHLLQSGELLVVPQNTWHRFETPDGVKILTATPQPTDHSLEKPSV